jgi:hypothetical protein
MSEDKIRQLAKQTESQNSFLASKELGMKLFANEIELSRVQNIYLSYLYFYHDLIVDVYSKKLSEKIFEDDFYEDAYAYYKREKKDEDDKKKGRQIHLVFPKHKPRKK